MRVYAQYLFAGLLLSVPAMQAAKVTIKIAPMRRACTVVHLPGWKKPALGPDTDWGHAMECDYDFRSVDGGVLVGAYCRPLPDEKPVYSPSKYAVYFGSGRVRKATAREWTNADPYLLFRVTANDPGIHFQPQQKLVYQGKEFPKTGANWPFPFGISHVSPDGKSLNVNSWDGTISSNGDDVWGKDYLDGHYYVDIYDIPSQQRLLAIQGEFHGVDPYFMFRDSAWLSKRYFMLPLDWQNQLRRFVICDVQRASHAVNAR